MNEFTEDMGNENRGMFIPNHTRECVNNNLEIWRNTFRWESEDAEDKK